MKNSSLSSRPEVVGRDRDWVRTSELRCPPRLSPESDLEFWRVYGGTGSMCGRRRKGPCRRGRDLGDYREIVLGQDASFAWHHLQLWAEVYESAFSKFRGSVNAGHASPIILKPNINLRRSFSVRCAGNQQIFGSIDDGRGRNLRWGQDLARHRRCVIGYRFNLAHPAQAAIQLSA